MDDHATTQTKQQDSYTQDIHDLVGHRLYPDHGQHKAKVRKHL